MLKKVIASSVVASTLLLGGISTANADAIGTGYLEIANFKLTNDAGTKLTLGTDIQFVDNNGDPVPPSAVTNDGDTNATLTNPTGSAPQTDGYSNQGPAGASLDVQAACVGDCSYVENSFAYIPKATVAAPDTHSIGDVLLTGAVINIGGVLPDANAKLMAEVSLESGKAKSGTSSGNNVGVDAAVKFVAGFTGGMKAQFDAKLFLRALLTSDETGLVANADSNFIISLRGDDNSFQQVNTLPLIQKIGAPNPGDDNGGVLYDSIAGPDATFVSNFAVNQGVVYDFSISGTIQSNAEILETVPVPATVALFGLGLLGLGFSRRRKV